MPSLFVDEDEMHVDATEVSEPKEEPQTELPSSFTAASTSPQDPIVKSIPLMMGRIPDLKTQSLHLLQYPGRPKKLQYKQVKASVKPKAGCLEIKVPLDTTKFYDETRADDWGTRVVENKLQGVLDKMESCEGPTGNYLAKVVHGEDGTQKIVLIPIDRTVQLRPAFTYLDDLENAKQIQRRNEIAAENAASNTNQAAVQVLQTSIAKQLGPAIGGDQIASHALGESLRSIKLYQEEDWKKLQFKDEADEKVVQINKQLGETNDRVLETKMSIEDYIILLIV